MKLQGKSHIHYAIKRAIKMPVAMAGAVNEIITAKTGFDENLQAAST
jgi:hypothetical protein